MKWSSNLIEEAVLGLMSSQDAPGSPAGEARGDFYQQLQGRSHAHRRAHRAALFSVTPESVIDAAEQIFFLFRRQEPCRGHRFGRRACPARFFSGDAALAGQRALLRPCVSHGSLERHYRRRLQRSARRVSSCSIGWLRRL